MLKKNDVVVSKVEGGHELFLVTLLPEEEMALVYRGDGWTTQYAVARGAKIAEGKGGDLWYSPDAGESREYLETFRSRRPEVAA